MHPRSLSDDCLLAIHFLHLPLWNSECHKIPLFPDLYFLIYSNSAIFLTENATFIFGPFRKTYYQLHKYSLSKLSKQHLQKVDVQLLLNLQQPATKILFENTCFLKTNRSLIADKSH